jgi:hypothetical protein
VAKTEDAAPENGKPTRSAPAPVIRKLVVAEEDSKTRLLKRQVPAWVISGLIHVVLIFAFIIFDRLTDKGKVDAKPKQEPTSTKMDEKPEKEIDLTNPDLGLDSDLNAAVEVDKESEFNVEAPVVENEANGLPNETKDFTNSITSQLGPVTGNIDATPGAIGDASLVGATMMGQGGPGGQLAMPGLQGRSGSTKEKLLRSGGGNDDTEAAVGRALAWLAKQQNTTTGFWEFDGSHKSDRVAATGMCLLPFLAAGETHKTGKKYKEVVSRGLNYLKAQIKPSGQFGNAGMYSQAIATISLCEAAGMTRDESVKKVARMAVDYIVAAQAGDGSWGYTPNTNGDTSIVGWQIQALKSARLADIAVPQKAFDQAVIFLDGVSNDSGATYGYRTKGSSRTLTPVGLLCRQYTGWTPRNPSLARGIDFMWDKYPPKENEWEMYYYYYATQVFHFFDGPKWHTQWNPAMQKILLTKQVTDKTPGAKATEVGSWPKDEGHIGSSCGRLGTTAMACLTLEVYYRHLPLYKRDNGGLAIIDK